MPIKKLINKEFVGNMEDVNRAEKVVESEGGWKYTYFEDPVTGKLYRPVKDFTIEGEDLTIDFVEIERD